MEDTNVLTIAALSGSNEVAAMLVAGGADINAYDAEKNTILSKVVDRGNFETAEILLANGAEPDMPIGVTEVTALHFAAHKGDKKIASLLLAKGADINSENLGGQSALVQALCDGQTEFAEFLLDNSADVNSGIDVGSSPLIWAADKGHEGLVKRMLSMGASINAVDQDGETSLYRAIDRGFITIAQLLIDHGADVTIPNKQGSTPLNIAAREGRGSIVLNSQFDPEDWYRSLHDAVIAESILNRIVSTAELVRLDGPNMRRHRHQEATT